MADAMAVAVALSPLADELAEEAVAIVAGECEPPFLERAALRARAAHDHATWEVRLFAS